MRSDDFIMKPKIMVGLLIVGGILSGQLLAQESPSVVQRSVIASAGEPVTDSQGSYRLQGSLGEAIVSPVVTQTGYGLGSGFWAGGGVLPDIRKIYLPVLLAGEE